MNSARCCTTVLLLVVLGAVTEASAQKGGLVSATFAKEKLSLAYPKKYYEGAKIRRLPKKMNQDVHGPPFDVGPARYAIELIPHHQQPRHGGRYYYPTYSVVYVTPLGDQTVPNFDKAYPRLFRSTRLLHELLSERPKDLYAWTVRRSIPSGGWEIPDEPFNNAGACLLAKFRMFSTKWGDGCRFLTYYRQGKAGYGATNEELFYNFQGTTKNNEFYVSARLAVHHDRLANSIDDPKATSNETDQEQQAEHDRIDRWPEITFFPPLASLDSMIKSLQIKQ